LLQGVKVIGEEKLTLGGFIAKAQAEGKPLSEIFLAGESEKTGAAREELMERMRQRAAVMRAALEQGLAVPQCSRSGLIKGAAHQLHNWQEMGASLLCPAFTRLTARAMAVGEVNACMGKIVAAPTAGSSGVLPAVLFTVAEERGLPEERILSALFTAGGIGMVIDSLATLSGARGGCEAEIGSASAMAAGGLVEMMGGLPAQVGDAVAFALKNILGLICDPVGGLVEIPCVKRNALGALNAVSAAEIALAGVTSTFSADQVIEAMGRVGKGLPEEFRETARGGLACLTPR